MNPVYDKLYGEHVLPCGCPCCEKCWLYVTGPKRGTCVHGGRLDPSRGRTEFYMGYIEVE
jgi:hypothetical protein